VNSSSHRLNLSKGGSGAVADWHQLADIVSELSESAYSAGWMVDSEFDVWRLASEGGIWGRIGAGELSAGPSSQMRMFAPEARDGKIVE
jgi:hypothetical protein